MSDPTAQQQTPDIGQQITSAPEKLWKRLQAALKVQTREQAVQLVGTDQAAAEAARTILSSASEDILTRKRQPEAAMLTAKRQGTPRAPQDVLYGGGGGLTI